MTPEVICTIEDFHKFIGPRARNMIQAITKNKKKELNYICQKCGQAKVVLEAAHINGQRRKDVINDILKNFFFDEEKKIVKVDLNKFEEQFINAHKPLREHFLFLCSECHSKYDSDKEPEKLMLKK